MKQSDFETFVMGLPDVQREESYGYSFFFVGSDHRLPFVTIADTDNEYDKVSNLDREGVFRLNIGVSKDTFNQLTAGQFDREIDYTAFNEFMSHPQYSRQHFVCILNPARDRAEMAKRLIVEAHGLAAERARRKGGD